MRPYLHTQRTHEMHFLKTPKSPIQSHSPISRRSGSATAAPLVAAPSPRLFSRDAPARLDVVAMAKGKGGKRAQQMMSQAPVSTREREREEEKGKERGKGIETLSLIFSQFFSLTTSQPRPFPSLFSLPSAQKPQSTKKT